MKKVQARSRARRRPLQLVLVVVAVLGLAAGAEASRYIPSTLAPELEAGLPSLDDLSHAGAGADTHTQPFALFTAEDHLFLAAFSAIDLAEVDRLLAGDRYRLFAASSPLPRPVELAVKRKHASGYLDILSGGNVWGSLDLAPILHRRTFQGLWTDPVTGLSYARAR